jgi:hypothetical protein
MGNGLKFLFDYREYMDHILEKQYKDDNDIYIEYKRQRLVEGLIKTHPLITSADILSKRFPELKCEIEPDEEIYIEGEFKTLKEYLPIFNNLGYFIAKLTYDGNNWVKDFNDDSKPLALFLEPKYDLKIYPIPSTLYHSTLSRFDNKIKAIGFIPKTGNKKSNHPERIYLTDSLNIAKKFALGLAVENNGEPTSIYEIDTTDMDITLYRDINLKNGGYYTLGNIHPKYFKKII